MARDGVSEKVALSTESWEVELLFLPWRSIGRTEGRSPPTPYQLRAHHLYSDRQKVLSDKPQGSLGNKGARREETEEEWEERH